jgi:hypothetical protein
VVLLVVLVEVAVKQQQVAVLELLGKVIKAEITTVLVVLVVVVLALLEQIIQSLKPQMVVLACNG